MTIQITIAGLGEAGSSVGLALQYHKAEIYRVGCDIHQSAEQAALNNNAVDKIAHNVFEATKDADILLLAVPSDEVEAMMKLVGHDLKEDAVVLDFCPTKRAAAQWAQQYLTHPDQYVGLYPSVNPVYLLEPKNAFHSAHEDLFRNGTMFIAPGPGTREEVIKLATDFSVLLGSYCAFTDVHELDGLTAALDCLPWIISNALFASVHQQPGWDDMRKIGSKSFAGISVPQFLRADQNVLGTTALQNQENLERLINDLIYSLKDYRDAIHQQNQEEIQSLLEKNYIEREKWADEYKNSSWRTEGQEMPHLPSFSDSMSELFLGALGRPRKK